MIIVRYLTKETLKSQTAVLFVLFLIFVSQKFIRVLTQASDGSIPGHVIMTLLGLYMPSMAMFMLPLSIYIGILLTFGRLYAESEVTVMNATGIGNRYLIRAALGLALITGSLALMNNFWLMPWANQEQVKVMQKVQQDSGLDLLVKGQFNRSPDGRGVVFVDNITDKGKRLERVFVAQTTALEKLQPSVMYSDHGVVKQEPDGRQVLILNNGTRYQGVPTQLDYTITHFDKYEAVIGKRKVRQKALEWSAMSMTQLYHSDDLNAKAEWQWRISLVLCIPILTMVVVPLSSVNPRQGRFAKLIPAVLIFLAYFLSISAAKSSVEDGSLPAYLGLWSVNGGALLLAVILNTWDTLPIRKLRDKLRRRS